MLNKAKFSQEKNQTKREKQSTIPESILSLDYIVYEEEKKLTFEITIFYCTLVLCDTIKEYSVDYTLQIF